MKRVFSRLRIAGVLMLSAGILSGCPGKTLEAPDLNDYSCLGSDATARLLPVVEQTAKLPNAFRAGYRLEVRKGIERQVLRQAVVFELPDRLRIDTFASAFEKLVSLVIAANGSFAALDAEKNAVYDGSSTPANIGRLTHLPLSEQQFAAWMLGVIPAELADPLARESLYLLKGDSNSEYSLRQDFGDGRTLRAYFRLLLNEGQAPQSRMEFVELSFPTSDGETEYVRARYSYEGDRAASCPKAIPREMTFSFSQLGVSGLLRCEQFEENPDLSELRNRLFKLRISNLQDSEVHHLD